MVPLEGIKVLGVPVGSAQWASARCEDVVRELEESLPLLADIPDMQTQLLLLGFCAHPRFIHMLRGVCPAVLQEAALRHDTAIQASLQGIAGAVLPLPDIVVSLSQLPRRWGGGGLTSAQRLSPAGYLGSWALVWAQMSLLFPHLAELLPHLGAPEGTAVGDLPTARQLQQCADTLARNRVDAGAVDESLLPKGASPTVSLAFAGFVSSRERLQKEFSTIAHAADFARLYADAPTNAAKARILSVSSQGAQAHWQAIPAFYQFVVPHDAGVAALSLQLGLPQPSLRGVRTCICGANIDPLGYHYLTCDHRGFTISRHHGLRDTVCEMLKTVYDPASVHKEPIHHHSYSPLHKPDVVVRNFDGRGNFLVVDTSVAFPCAPTYVDNAARTRLYAAKLHEAAKIGAYGNMGSNELVPFAVETFGALGPAARALLSRCSRIRRNRLGPEAAESTWSARSFTSYWSQRLAVCLQVDLGRGICARAADDYVP